MFTWGKILKRILLKLINKYSLLYLPLIWLFGFFVYVLFYNPSIFLYILTAIVLMTSLFLYRFTANRGVLLDGHKFSDYKYTIIEYYSDYWLGCTASQFIVNEFTKNNPDIPIVSINARKKDYEEIIERYRLKYTPTYVLVDQNAEKIYKRVGSFSYQKFQSLIA